MTEKDGLAYFQKAADLNSGDAMTTLAVFYANGKGGVDKNLARAEALCDEIDMPETVWMEMTSPEQRTGMIATTKQEIIHERLRRGGDADAKGYSFVHDPLQEDTPMGSQRICSGCMKTAPQGAGMKKCQGCKVCWYCSKECQKADWPRHKADCSLMHPDAKIDEKWFRSCPGLLNAVWLTAYINRNAIPVIDISTMPGDDGSRPVVTVIPKHELMNFNWGWRMSQKAPSREYLAKGPKNLDTFQIWVHLDVSHLNGSQQVLFGMDGFNFVDRSKTVLENKKMLNAAMTWQACTVRNRVAEVRAHTNLETADESVSPDTKDPTSAGAPHSSGNTPGSAKKTKKKKGGKGGGGKK